MTYTSPMHMCYNHSINTYCCVFSFKDLKTAIYRSEQLLQFGEQGFILTISKEKLTIWVFVNVRFPLRRHLLVRQRVPTMQGLRLVRAGFCT